MSRIAFAAVFALSFAATAVHAQTMGTGFDSAVVSPKTAAQQPGTAATTSGAGNLGTGASSDVLGTGNTQGKGVMSPQAPGLSGHGATGANPDKSGGVNSAQ
jgi:hypothetical protein